MKKYKPNHPNISNLFKSFDCHFSLVKVTLDPALEQHHPNPFILTSISFPQTNWYSKYPKLTITSLPSSPLIYLPKPYPLDYFQSSLKEVLSMTYFHYQFDNIIETDQAPRPPFGSPTDYFHNKEETKQPKQFYMAMSEAFTKQQLNHHIQDNIAYLQHFIRQNTFSITYVNKLIKLNPPKQLNPLKQLKNPKSFLMPSLTTNIENNEDGQPDMGMGVAPGYPPVRTLRTLRPARLRRLNRTGIGG